MAPYLETIDLSTVQTWLSQPEPNPIHATARASNKMKHDTKKTAEIGPSTTSSNLWIVGLGHQYPPYSLDAEQLASFLSRFCDIETPAMKKLLEINKATMINKRSIIKAYEDPFWFISEAPSISDLDAIFRTEGVSLTVEACRKALRDSGLDPADITHTVAVTCTNAGNPGFDLLVAQKLDLAAHTERTLLHGVGCAGGLSALRAAAALAQSSMVRGRPARILVFACELCTINVRQDLQGCVDNPAETRITPALFSDGAAAVVLCNEQGIATRPECQRRASYELVDWEVTTVPGTSNAIGMVAKAAGWDPTLSKDVPRIATKNVVPMLQRLVPELQGASEVSSSGRKLRAKDFDWALHPGGIAILNGVQQRLELNEDQLRASFDVYRNHGNSSSPTVLIVLDQLRKMGPGRDQVVACSFGPGMGVEMAMLRRCVYTSEEEDFDVY